MVYKSVTFGAIALALLQLVNGASNFLAISPSNFAPDSYFTVAVANLADAEAANITVTLQGTRDNHKPFLKTDTVALERGQSDVVEFWIGNVPLGEYELIVNTTSDDDEVVPVRRTAVRYHPKVVIQTDRPIYTPGSVVKFRILMLDQGLKPMKSSQVFTVELLDPVGDIIKVWRDVGIKQIFTAQIELAGSPNLGEWTIKVSTNDRDTVRSFEVLHKAAPVYEISIKPSKITTQRDKDLALGITARYLYGRPMDGWLQLTLDGGKQMKHSMHVANGQGSFSLPLASLLESTENGATQWVVLNGTFTVISDGDRPWNYSIQESIPIYPTPYKLEIQTSTTRFMPGKPYTFFVAITDPLGARLQQIWKPLVIRSHEQSLKTLNQPLSSDGTATVTIDTSPSSSSITIDIEYLDVSESLELKSIDSSSQDEFEKFELSILTHEPSSSSPLVIAVFANFPLGVLVYTVSSTGTIYSVESIHANNVTYIELEINISNAVAAEAQVNAYARLDGRLLSATSKFKLSNITSNEIKLMTSRKTAKPGDILSLTATTRPGALVGFLAVNSGLIKEPDDFWNILLKNVEMQHEDEQESNVVAVSSLALTHGGSLRSSVGHEEMDMLYRRKLEESWLWIDATADDEGEAVATVTVPDTLTEWSIGAFSFHETGLAMVPKPNILHVKKPVVLMLNVPYSIKINEAAVVEVFVFNEHSSDNSAIVRLENPSNEFSFLNNSGRTDAIRNTKYLVIKQKGMGTAEFVIQPKKLGTIKLQVAVIMYKGVEDAVEQMLRVLPESLPYNKKDARVFDLVEDVQNTTLDLFIPLLHDQGSENIVFSLFPAVPTARKVSDLLVSAEDSDAFVKTTLAALTLEAYDLDDASDEHLENAANEVLVQYQNLLHHKQDDGSFSLVAKAQGSGSCLATTIAIRSLITAKNHIFIMESVLSKAFEWLQMCQSADGGFVERNVKMARLEDTIDLTSHAILAMLELQLYREKYSGAIGKGLEFLTKSIVEGMDAYYTAKGAYVLHIANSPAKDRLFYELLQKKELKDKMRKPWWRSNESSQAATGYALLCYIQRGLVSDAAEIMKSLAMEPRAAIAPTASTTSLVALEALVAYRKRTSPKRNKLHVTVSVPKFPDRPFQIDEHVTEKTIALPKETRSVNVLINGTGTGMFEVSYSYLSSIENMQPRFEIEVRKLPTSEDSYIDLTICARFLDKISFERTNMVVMEVAFPSGYIVLDDTLDDLKEVEHITNFRAKHDDTVLVMYMEELTWNMQCVNVTGFKRSRALLLAPGTVKVFDLYDDSRVAIAYFDK